MVVPKKPEFTVKEIFPGIVHLKYRSKGAMTRALVRMQEHYEHPLYRGQVFTVADLRRHTKSLGEDFSYFTTVTGMNFPSAVLRPFYGGRFDPISKREQAILTAFANRRGKFYVIASVDDNDTPHEISHGLYYTQPKYRKKVKEILRDQEKIGGMSDWRKSILEEGYHKAVVDDEVHAYMMESDEYLKGRFKRISGKLGKFSQARKRLWDAYNAQIALF